MTTEEIKARLAALLAQNINDIEAKADTFVDRHHMPALNRGSMITTRAHARAALADFVLAASKADAEKGFEKLDTVQTALSEAEKNEAEADAAIQKTLADPNLKADALIAVKKEHADALRFLADAKYAVSTEIARLGELLQLLDTLQRAAIVSIAKAKETCCWF